MGSVLDDDKLRMVKSGEQVECPLCHKGHFVTKNPDVKKAHIFRCNNCGKVLEFIPQIDLRNL